jgi:Predicted esterase of the alpha-beta hydrolase superfamily
MKKMKTALVLSGGGSRGSYEVGVWQALCDAGIDIDMACGTSVGAINAAMVVLGDAARAGELWKTLETDMIFDRDTDAKPYFDRLDSIVRSIDELSDKYTKVGSAFETLGGVIGEKGRELNDAFARKAGMTVDDAIIYSKEIIKEHGAGSSGMLNVLKKYIPAGKFFKSKVDYGMITCEYPSFREEYFYKEDIPHDMLHEHIAASASCFPAARYSMIGDKKYVDGGYGDNLPVKMALFRGVERIVSVNLKAVGTVDKKLLDEVEKRHPNYITVEPKWDLGNFLVFEPDVAARNLRLGYLDGMKALGLLDGDRFAFKKGAFKADEIMKADDAAYLFRLDPEKVYTRTTLKNELKKNVAEAQKMLAERGIEPAAPSDKIKPSEALRKLQLLKAECPSEALAVYIAGSLKAFGEDSIYAGRNTEKLMKDEVRTAKYIVEKGLLGE